MTFEGVTALQLVQLCKIADGSQATVYETKAKQKTKEWRLIEVLHADPVTSLTLTTFKVKVKVHEVYLNGDQEILTPSLWLNKIYEALERFPCEQLMEPLEDPACKNCQAPHGQLSKRAYGYYCECCFARMDHDGKILDGCVEESSEGGVNDAILLRSHENPANPANTIIRCVACNSGNVLHDAGEARCQDCGLLTTPDGKIKSSPAKIDLFACRLCRTATEKVKDEHRVTRCSPCMLDLDEEGYPKGLPCNLCREGRLVRSQGTSFSCSGCDNQIGWEDLSQVMKAQMSTGQFPRPKR